MTPKALCIQDSDIIHDHLLVPYHSTRSRNLPNSQNKSAHDCEQGKGTKGGLPGRDIVATTNTRGVLKVNLMRVARGKRGIDWWHEVRFRI